MQPIKKKNVIEVLILVLYHCHYGSHKTASEMIHGNQACNNNIIRYAVTPIIITFTIIFNSHSP